MLRYLVVVLCYLLWEKTADLFVICRRFVLASSFQKDAVDSWSCAL